MDVGLARLETARRRVLASRAVPPLSKRRFIARLPRRAVLARDRAVSAEVRDLRAAEHRRPRRAAISQEEVQGSDHPTTSCRSRSRRKLVAAPRRLEHRRVAPRRRRPPPATAGATPAGTVAGIVGVTSKSAEASIRSYNGRTHDNEWALVRTARRFGSCRWTPHGGARRARNRALMMVTERSRGGGLH